MEIEKNTLLDEEEPLIIYYSTMSNFGVHSKKIKSSEKFSMPFTPLSSNREISFSNTVMLPIIITESSIDEKSKSKSSSMRKDVTRLKTESSKDDKNNISEEKQITKILIESIEGKIDEATKENFDDNKNNIEKNPYFFGTFERHQNPLLNYEQNKVCRILNKKNIDDKNNFQKTTKEINKRISYINTNSKKNLANKLIEKIYSSKDIISKDIILKEEIQEKKFDKKFLRKSTKKYNTCANYSGSIYKSLRNKNSDKELHNKKNNNNDKNSIRSNRKRRECTVIDKSPFIKFHDNNIKMYRASLFNKNSSSKLKIKLNTNLKGDKEIQKQKEKNKKINKNDSKNSFNLHLNIESDETQKNKKKIIGKKLHNQINPQTKENENEINYADLISRKRTKSKSFMYKRFNKLKTFTKEIALTDTKKLQNISKRKISETRKNIDFESALKNAKNSGNTQYNLFSPDKFTNTEFCGSDYCEYTLGCMDLILSQNRSQKIQKSKVNFNFSKNQKNKLKKKIVLFDLDETLVHCTGDINLKKETFQHSIDIVLPGNKEVKVGINIRPYWKKTMKLIKRYYNIVVFTASHQAYADAVLDFMDPDKKYFKHRLYRNNCSLVDIDGSKFYVKDLDIFDEFYDLKDIVIIDNSVLSFLYHLENGIPIVPYYNEDKDSSLYVVGLYLMHIYKENDLRKANKKYINLDSFLNEARIRKNINDEQNIINEESFSSENKNGDNNKDLQKNMIEKNTQNKLKSQSTLINTYYEINDKSSPRNTSKKENIEEKNYNSDSSDEEKIIKTNKTIDEFFNKTKLLKEDKPNIIQNKFKSAKTHRNYSDINMIKSNFDYNFSRDKSIIKQ